MHRFIGIILLVFVVAFAFFAYNKLPQYLDLNVGPDGATGPPAFKSKLQPIPSEFVPKSIVSEPGITSNVKKVRISSVYRKSFGRQYSEINLTTNLPAGEKINITGWKIESNKKSFNVPKGIEIFEPGGLSGPRDIYLHSGDRAKIFSNTSRNGANFMLNKCTGYLETAGAFIPSLPKICPRPQRSEIANFSGACQDYILRLPTCAPPSGNPPIPYNDDACREFLKKLYYSGCFEKYKNDADFLSKEWRIWLGDSFGNEVDIFDPLHDRVRLYDKGGELVDEYVY